MPALLGFHPAESLVVLGIGGPHARIRLAFRYDLPDPPEEGLAADIAAHAVTVLNRQHLGLAIAVGYGSGRQVTPVADVLAPALRAGGIEIQDILRVQDGRYWSYVCTDPRCCPPSGVPFDPAGHPAAAALAAAGLTARSDRAELARTLAQEEGSGPVMEQAVQRAQLRAARLIAGALADPRCADPYQQIADAGRRSMRLAVARYRRGARLTEHQELAWLGIALTDMRVRDDAWARMDPDYHDAHRQLWTDLVRHLPAEYVPAPAALLAFTAWQAGDGALASVAIERALAVDPEYSMALLLADALHAGLPPSAARLPMTPKQVAASYARRRQAGDASNAPPGSGEPAGSGGPSGSGGGAGSGGRSGPGGRSGSGGRAGSGDRAGSGGPAGSGASLRSGASAGSAGSARSSRSARSVRSADTRQGRAASGGRRGGLPRVRPGQSGGGAGRGEPGD